jgi:hypothetical protein
VGFEPTIPAFERAKTVHALGRAATVTGSIFTAVLNLRFSGSRAWRIAISWDVHQRFGGTFCVNLQDGRVAKHGSWKKKTASRAWQTRLHNSDIMYVCCVLELSIPCCTIRSGSRDSAVGKATGYGLYDRGVGVRVAVRSRIFSSPRRSDRFWGPPSLLSNGYRGVFPGG